MRYFSEVNNRYSSSWEVVMTDDVFTESQWQTLLALVDSVVPSIVVGESTAENSTSIAITQGQFDRLYGQIQQKMASPPTAEEFQQYLKGRPAHNAKFVGAIKGTIASLAPTPRKQLGFILSVIGTRIGSLISTGYLTTISQQSTSIREAIIKSWQQSWLFIWPIIATNILTMGRVAWSTTDPLLLRISGYEQYMKDARLSKPGPLRDFEFLEFNNTVAESETIETDVIVVGSGCGGGVCAKVLAEAGHRVIVVDKGYYFSPDQLPLSLEAGSSLFEGKGSLSTVDGQTFVSAGSCWGGGGTVNWSASIATPDEVRSEWAEERGLWFFKETDYEASIDRASEMMGVSDSHVNLNHGNKVILEGARTLGWRSKVVAQNSGSSKHNCGALCAYGCRTSTKQGPAVSWLPAAVKAGARSIEGFEVSEILWDDDKGPKKAVGIVGTWTPRNEGNGLQTMKAEKGQKQIYIKAKKVILSGGSLNSPLILLRSGLKNAHIGKNLYLHPCSVVLSVFEEDVRGWEDEILTSLMYEFENLDGKGHGVRVETANMLPFLSMLQIPWHSALQFKVDALGFRHMNNLLCLARDRSTGSVYPDVDGSPTVAYTLSRFDRESIQTGAIAAAKICYIQGATELIPPVRSVPIFKSDTPTAERKVDDAEFASWIKQLAKADFTKALLVSGHQMGSCRMSKTKEQGVVDENGKVWDTENLYVADASVFPSASGVNPMITIMAISDRIARGVAAGLR
ncbi:long-chain fatty alcohol dehydrogenase [Daldinia sp. FL1419]|nr:long-chain fatty alcohol dehydrogenase [Daldinia sp. FL1419]